MKIAPWLGRRSYAILVGDATAKLRELPAESFRCCVTSPPYWGLRDYGMETQIGLEQSPEEWVAALVGVFREVRRVLADDGTLWVNCGDAYMSQGGNTVQHGPNAQCGNTRSGVTPREGGPRDRQPGLKTKDLIGLPWMLAFALRADGWYLRSDIIWSKPNPMPESVRDRPTKAHEYLFLLSKRERYYFDADAIAEASVDKESLTGRNPRGKDEFTQKHGDNFAATRTGFSKIEPGRIYATRNRRTVWEIPTQPYAESHFATFPEALVRPCIKAGSAIGDAVLDPFAGSGTVGAVACPLGRSFIGTELNPEYAEMAERRIRKALRPQTARDEREHEAPLFGVKT